MNEKKKKFDDGESVKGSKKTNKKGRGKNVGKNPIAQEADDLIASAAKPEEPTPAAAEQNAGGAEAAVEAPVESEAEQIENAKKLIHRVDEVSGAVHEEAAAVLENKPSGEPEPQDKAELADADKGIKQEDILTQDEIELLLNSLRDQTEPKTSRETVNLEQAISEKKAEIEKGIEQLRMYAEQINQAILNDEMPEKELSEINGFINNFYDTFDNSNKTADRQKSLEILENANDFLWRELTKIPGYIEQSKEGLRAERANQTETAVAQPTTEPQPEKPADKTNSQLLTNEDMEKLLSQFDDPEPSRASAKKSETTEPEAKKEYKVGDNIEFNGKEYPILHIDDFGHAMIEAPKTDPNGRRMANTKIWLNIGKDKISPAPPEGLPIEDAAPQAPAPESKNTRGNKIEMPDDEEKIAKLQNKLKEYTARLDRQMNQTPAASTKEIIDTNYKIFVLDRLLTDGEVYSNDLFRELQGKTGIVDSEIFIRAFSVVEDYAATGGKNTFEGTGFDGNRTPAEAAPAPEIAAETAVEQASAPEQQKNTVLRNIFNQGILREKLLQETATQGETLSADRINELAKSQAEFVKAQRIEELIIKKNNKIKEIFKPEGRQISQDDLRKELVSVLLDQKSIANQKKLTALSRQISNETGLGMEEVQNLISEQEQRLRDQALSEINAGRLTSETGEAEAAQNAAARKSRGWKMALTKSVAYIGGGALLTAATGGVGAIATIAGVRIIDRLITDRLQKKKVDAKFSEIKAGLENDPEGRNNMLNGLFTEIAAAQQKRISGDFKFNFEDFTRDNEDLLAGYEDGEQKQVIRALNALQRIDEINYIRERDLFERLSDRIKDSKLGIFNKTAVGFNRFMIKGGENTWERAVSAAMFGGLAIAAREMPIIRNAMLAVSGWKAGDAAGRAIWGDKKAELGVVEDKDLAIDILDFLRDMEKNKTTDKQKRLLMKAGTSLLFASMPAIAGLAMDQLAAHQQAGGHQPFEHANFDKLAVAKPSAAAELGHAAPSAVENPYDKAFADINAVHGQDSHHFWGLTYKKLDAGIKDLPGVDEVAVSKGRMDFLIDSIKDKVAENPGKYGFPEGANIDHITAADLERLSQNGEFNKLIIETLNPNEALGNAMDLSEAAVSNIEGNSAFFNETVQKIPADIRLGQHDYDLMTQLHNKGMSSNDAAKFILNEHLSSAGAAGTEHIVAATETAPPSSGIEAVMPETAGSTPIIPSVENIPDIIARNNWHDVYRGIDSGDKIQTGKSLAAVFDRSGLTKDYGIFGLPKFQVENVAISGGKLNFEVPAPVTASGVENLKFSFNPVNNELTASTGAISEKISNIRNIDTALKTAFNNVSNKLNASVE